MNIPQASDYLETIKRLIDDNDVETLKKVIVHDPDVINMTFEHAVYVIIPDKTALYQGLRSTTEYDGNHTDTIPRNITFTDYACIKEQFECFKLLLNRGCPASIYSVQYIGRVIDYAVRDGEGYKCAVRMLVALLVKYPNIQDVRQDPEVSPNGVTYSSVFPYGSTYEYDEEWSDANKSPPMIYLHIMLDHGVKKDTEPPKSYKDIYFNKMHSFKYSIETMICIRDLIRAEEEDEDEEEEEEESSPTYSMVTERTREKIVRKLMYGGCDMH